MTKDSGKNHDNGDGDQDPVAVALLISIGTLDTGDGRCRAYNNWGSRWRVCTGSCAIVNIFESAARGRKNEEKLSDPKRSSTVETTETEVVSGWKQLGLRANYAQNSISFPGGASVSAATAFPIGATPPAC